MTAVHLHLLLNRAVCDYRCTFCFMGSDKHVAENARLVAELDYDEEWRRIESIIDEGRNNPEINALHIMGNDPCHHPHLIRAVEYAKQQGYCGVVLESNAVAYDDAELAAGVIAAGVTKLKIPVYGATAEVHDAIVRLPGAFDRLMAALNNFAEHKVEIRLHALLLNQNIQDLAQADFRYPLHFRYPFRHEGADFDFAHHAPRLSEIDAHFLRYSDLHIPCVNGCRLSEEHAEARFRPESVTAGEGSDEDFNRCRQPPKCSPESCPEHDVCGGIYAAYVELYGQDEFDPSNVEAAVQQALDSGDSPHGVRENLVALGRRLRSAFSTEP